MSDDVIGLGSQEVMSGGRAPRYKGETGVTDRIALVWFAVDDDGNPKMSKEDEPRIKRDFIHYLEDLGYVSDCPYLTQKRGQPKIRLGTAIVVYKTDNDGEFPKDGEGNPQFSGFDVMTWEFGRDKYKSLSKIHKQFPLTYHDVLVTCEDSNYQRMSFTPCAGEAVWRKNPKLRQKVLDKVEEIKDQISLGREVPVERLREYFGEDDIATPEVAEDVEDYEDLLGDL